MLPTEQMRDAIHVEGMSRTHANIMHRQAGRVWRNEPKQQNKKLAKYLWEIQSYAFYIGILLNELTLIFLAFLFEGSRSLATWRCEVLPLYNQGNQGRRLQRWCEKNCVEALPYQR